MKSLISKSALIFVLFLAAFLNLEGSARANSMDEDVEITYNISTNNIYFPGDEILINLYSYSYDERMKDMRSVSFRFQIYKIRDVKEFYSRQSSRYNLDVLGSDSTNLTYLADEIDSFNKKIKIADDYGYMYLNESVKINMEEKGAYLVKVTRGKQVAYCGFIISSLGVIAKAGGNSMLAYVVDRKSGEPISNADLNFFIGNRQIGKGDSRDGLFFQEVKPVVYDGLENPNPLIIGSKGDDIVISDAYLYFGYGDNRYYTYIYTNQPVYRTESLVEFKGTIRSSFSSNYEAYSNKAVTVTIKDSRNAEVYKEVVNTNEMGSFNGSYKIDKEAPLGTYYIYVNIDESNTYSSSFEVEQFKKPEYKVTVTTDKSQYYGDDNLQGKVEAKYYFGSPVDGAEVEYNIYKKRYYKPWWSFSRYAWWYADYYANIDQNSQFSGAEFIYSGTGELNSDGTFEFDYKINEEFKEDEGYDYWWYYYPRSSDYQYIVQARVVDKSRREISGVTTAFVTRGGFYLTARADKYLYKPYDEVNIEVRSNDFSDNPVQTDFEVVIYRNNWSRGDGKYNKDYVATVTGSTRSDGIGMAKYKIDNSNPQGYYSMEVKAKDDRGKEITTTANFYCSDGDMSWYYNQSGGVQIITDKDSYTKGEICRALIITTAPGANVLTTTQSENILSYRVDRFIGTSMMIDIPITEDYNSNFDVNVSYVKEGVFHTTSKPLIVIQEDKFLTVEIEPSQEIYKPKDTGELKVRVLDNYGNPVRNAEVSLGIIDESIYAIKDETTKDIRKFFYGPKYTTVSTTFNSYNSNHGYSRLLTIFEKFNIRSMSDKSLATVRGRLIDKENNPIPNATIVVDKDYIAAVTDEDGRFEFKLPEGEYQIGLLYSGGDDDNIREIELSRSETKTITLYNDKTLNELQQDLEIIQSEETGIMDGATTLNLRGGRDDNAPVSNQDKKESPKSKLANDELGGEKDAERLMTGVDDDGFANTEVRSDFRDAIFWAPYERTDENGYATVYVKYPDNLTSWRITSRVITEGTKVGQNAKVVITRKDLLVRMETPRFLQQDDEVTISTIVHNYLNSTKETKVKFRADNVIFDGESEKTITLEPNSDQRLDWTIRVNEPVGEATLYVEALTDEESDALEIKVPLQPKGLKVNDNTIADFSEENKIEIKNIFIPEGTDVRSAGMKFTVSPSLASTILSALDELAGYPYGCVEQTMSRFLPTVVVASAFKELNAPISEATQKDLPKMVDAGLKRLYGFQHSDGGWGWWHNDQSRAFMTAYVVYGLSIAKSAGYEIRKDVISKGIVSMKEQLKNELDPTTRAYVLYSLAVAEDRDTRLFEDEIDKVLASSEVNNYTLSLVALTLDLIGDETRALSIMDRLEGNIELSGEGAAYWDGIKYKYNWQDDKVQTTAMGLKALVKIKGSSNLKDKVVRWLMMQRQGLSWRNTQESAFIVFAMVDYLKNSNELAPNYNVKVYVNDELYMDKLMTRDDVFKKDELIEIDAGRLRTGNNEVRIEKSGTGKVYFSSNTIYYNSQYIVESRENGFRVEREYYKLEKYEAYSEDKITYRKQFFDGTATTGDVILVKLKVYPKDKDVQNYFMLEDPLPAGCEVVKDDWAYQVEEEPNYTGYDYYYWRWWYADKDVRDNMVTFFATQMYGESFEFSYIMRAQIPGTYTVNPAQGMLMYYTDVNGSSQDLVLKINDK